MDTLADFPLDLSTGGGILNSRRSKNEGINPLADSFELGLVLAVLLAGGLGLFSFKLSPPSAGFFVG